MIKARFLTQSLAGVHRYALELTKGLDRLTDYGAIDSLPQVNVEIFSLALSHGARGIGAGEDRRVLLVLDQAGWHPGKEVEVA